MLKDIPEFENMLCCPDRGNMLVGYKLAKSFLMESNGAQTYLNYQCICALSQSGFPNETEPIGWTYIYICITGIGSCSYGGWEFPRSAIYKLRNRESQWYHSVQVQWPKNQNVHGHEKMMSQLKKKEGICSLTFCFIKAAHRLDDANQPTITWGLNQRLISFRSSFTNTPRNNDLPASWASLIPVK